MKYEAKGSVLAEIGRQMGMSKKFLRGGRNLAIHLLLLAALVSSTLITGPSEAEAQAGAVPFDCDGTPYIMQNSRMYEVVPDPANPGLFLFNEVGTFVGYGNSIGFDPVTNLVYGVQKVGGAWTVLTYDATWSVVNSQPLVEAPGSPTYPANGSNYAGTVLGDGSYMVATYNAAVPGSTNHNLWNVDAATGLATWVGPISPQNPSLADFAYNPADGYMYHVAGGFVQQLDPLTGAKTPLGAAPGLGGGFGSSYFDAAGNLFVHRNSDGNLFKIGGVGTGTNTVELVADTPSVSGADAASCVGEIDLLKDVVDAAGDPVALEDRVYAPGDIVYYEFTIINNALPAGDQALSLCDVLPADGRTYTGVATSATSISFTTPFGPGATDFCLDVVAPSSLWADPSQPGGDPVTVTIEVELGPDMVPGEYENQATLESPFDPGDFVLSDDPGDGSDPEDATTIQVTGEFSVSKTVTGHPGGNNTDSFTIAITCVDADNASFDVSADNVVDAAGDPWPGAATNSFPITDGELARVVGLPAGATCSAVESPVPSAYAASATSTETALDAGGELVIDQAPGEEAISLTNATGQFTLGKTTSAETGAAADLDLTGVFPIQVTCRFDGVEVLPATVFNVDASAVSASGATGLLEWPDLPLLPAGTQCQAIEQVPAGWTSPTGPVSFTISSTDVARAEFENIRQLATLSVTKTISGLPASDDPDDYDFEVNVTCTGGFENPTETFGPFPLGTDLAAGVDGLPVGSVCQVVETPTAEFSPVYSPAGGSITIEQAGSAVAIDNVTGTLIIQKDTIAPTTPAVDPTDDFEFTMVCTRGGTEIFNDTVTVSVTDESPANGATGGVAYGDPQIPLLPPGTECTITEIVPDGWSLTSAPSATITIPSDGIPPTALFVNERDVADLSVAKTIEGLPEGVDASSFSFDVTVTCSHATLAQDYMVGPFSLVPGSNQIIEDLPVGAECTATEASDVRFTPTLPAGPIVIEVGGSTLPIINTTQALTIEKTATAADPSIDLSGDFPFVVTCTNGVTTNVTVTTDATGTGIATYPELPLYADGTSCTVTETVPAGWALTSGNDVAVDLEFDGGTGGFGTPAGADLVTDNCQNGDGNAPFSLIIRNTTGGPVEWTAVWANRPYDTIPNLNPGPYTHTVIDNGDNTYDHVFTGTAPLSGSLFITGGTPSPAGPGSCDDVALFVNANDAGGNDPDTGSMVSFANTRLVGDLTVTKTLVGLPASALETDYGFTVDVNCAGDFVGGTQAFTNVTLSTTTNAVFEDLPTGAQCTVLEAATDEFTASYPAGNTVTIVEGANSVQVVNTTSTFAITKTTDVPTGVEQDGTFSFGWSCDNVAATAGTGTITTENGTGSLTFADGLPLVPPGTTCSIDESALPAGWVATATPLSVLTAADSVATAAFMNTRTTGDIIVTKSIVGLASAEDPTQFDFFVDVECTGDFADDPLLLPNQLLKTNQPLTIPDLPTGAECSIVEQPDVTWTPLYDPVGGAITVVEGTNELSIVNSTGNLIIFKENFVPATHPIDGTGDFDFEIDCLSPLGARQIFTPTLSADTSTPSGAIGGITYDELGVSFATGTTCTVTELTPPTGWSILSDNPVEITITADGNPTAEFRNGRDVGDLTITKTIEGLPAGVLPTDFAFEVTVVCNNEDLSLDYTVGPFSLVPGTDYVIEDLPTGAECVASEAADVRFAPTLPASPTVVETGGAVLPIINTTRALTIEKTTTAADPSIDLRGDFPFVVTCTNGVTTNVTVTTDATGTGIATYPQLPLYADGTSCTVTETVPNGWTLDTPNDITVPLVGASGTAAFSNSRESNDLTITKSIVGLPAGALASDYSFTVDVVCMGGFSSSTDERSFDNVVLTVAGATISDLPTGADCTVTEDAVSAFTASYPNGQDITVLSGTTTVPIVNETSTFEITKQTQVPAGVVEDAEFNFSWSCNDPASSTGSASITTIAGEGTLNFADGLPLVPVGTSCTVDEVNLPTGWTATDTTITTTTQTGGPISFDFVNVRDTASLTVTKAIQGFPGDFEPDLNAEDFPITVTCSGDFDPSPASFPGFVSVDTNATFPNLPTGAECSVVESPDTRFFPVYSPPTITITTGANTVDVLNMTGELLVVKNTIIPTDRPIDPLGDFEFQITCVGPDGTFDETRTVSVNTLVGGNGTGGIRYDTLPLFADGTECTIQEINVPAGWENTSETNPVVVTIDSTSPATAAFENTRQLGSVVVSKTIEGLPDDVEATDFTFQVTVICSGDDLDGDYSIGPIDIVPGTDQVIDELPTGAECRVTEEPDPAFTPTLPDPVTIADAPAELAIVNTTSTFAVSKRATAASALPISLVGDFTFAIDCGAAGSAVVEITTAADGTGSATHSDGVPLVAPGTACTVDETALPPGWTEAGTNPTSVTTVDGSVVEIEFTNERDLVELAVDKLIDGPDGLVVTDFQFEVDVTCTNGFSTANDRYELLAEPLATNQPIVIAGLPAGATCTAVEATTNEFTASYEPESGTVLLGSDETITITNTTTTFAFTKRTVVVGSGEDDAEFQFAWSCNDPANKQGVATIVTENGTGSFEFSDGLPIVPPGTICSIDETDLPDGWEVTESPLELTTVAGDEPSVEFVNTRTTADLTISKVILGLLDSDDPTSFSFLVDITCIGDFPGGQLELNNQPLDVTENLVIENLPTGAECTVVEQPETEFAPLYGPESGTVTIEPEGAGVAVNNLTGRVSFAKQTIVPSAQPINPTASFDFQIVCDNQPVPFDEIVTVTTDTITAAGAIGIPDIADFPLLAPGTLCTITELVDPASGWLLTSSSNPIELEIRPEPNPGSFVNTRDVADLTISKIIQGLPAEIDPTEPQFEVTATCQHATLPADFSVGPLLISTDRPTAVAGLPTDAICTVTETPDPAYAISYDNQTVTVTSDGAAVQVTNSTGELTVTKQTVNPGGLPISLEDTFGFNVTCDNGIDTSFDITTDVAGTGSVGYPTVGLIPEGGSCTATEVSTPGEWTPEQASIDITIEAGLASADFVNTRNVADLTVTKTLEGVPDGVDLDAELFGIDVSCDGDFTTNPYVVGDQVSVSTPYVLADIPTGASCSVTELADPRFLASYTPDPATVTVTEAGGLLEITNSTGELIVAKDTVVPVGSEIDPTGTFTFDIICTNPDTAEIVLAQQVEVAVSTLTPTGATGGVRYSDLELMPDGTLCTITEIDIDPEWELTSANGVMVEIDSSAPTTASFTNERVVEDLEVTKAIAGLPFFADGTFDGEPFEVTVTCAGDFVGTARVIQGLTVSVDEPLTVADLPTNATCSVTETDDPRFTPVYDPAETTIVAGATSELRITNLAGDFVLLKETVVDSSHPIEAIEPFEFRLVCTGPGGNLVTDEIYIVEPGTSTAAGAIGGLRYADLPLLAAGTTCLVSEENIPADWTLTTPNNVEVTISATETPTLQFVNEHDTGDLEIRKTTVGLPEGVNPADLTFEISVVCNHPNLITDYEAGPVFVSGEGTVVIEDLPANAICTVDEVADDRFSPIYSPAATVTVPHDDTVSVGILNETAEIVLTKRTTVPSTHPIDPTSTFEFEIVCVNAGVESYREVHEIVADLVTPTGAIGMLSHDALPFLAAGTECTATEINIGPAWTPAGATAQTIVIDPTNPTSFDFENLRRVGSVQITKQITGLPEGESSEDYVFTAGLTCDSADLPASYTVEGIELIVGTAVQIDDLPALATCELVESPDVRFTPSYSPAASVVIDETVQTIAVDNSTGTLTINKTVQQEPGKAGSFTIFVPFDVQCENGYQGTHTLTTDDQGTASASWPEIPLLAAGVRCTITEPESEDWQILGDSVIDVVIAAGTAVEVGFLNELRTGANPALGNRPVVVSDASNQESTATSSTLAEPAQLAVPNPVAQPAGLAQTGGSQGSAASAGMLLIGSGFLLAALARTRRRKDDDD